MIIWYMYNIFIFISFFTHSSGKSITGSKISKYSIILGSMIILFWGMYIKKLSLIQE